MISWTISLTLAAFRVCRGERRSAHASYPPVFLPWIPLRLCHINIGVNLKTKSELAPTNESVPTWVWERVLLYVEDVVHLSSQVPVRTNEKHQQTPLTDRKKPVARYDYEQNKCWRDRDKSRDREWEDEGGTAVNQITYLHRHDTSGTSPDATTAKEADGAERAAPRDWRLCATVSLIIPHSQWWWRVAVAVFLAPGSGAVLLAITIIGTAHWQWLHLHYCH